MPTRAEEFSILRWADTVSVQYNILIYKAIVILIFAYNKANTNNNNSFYNMRSLYPLVQGIIYVYFVYICPFRNLISRSLEALPKSSTNPHLFSRYNSAIIYFFPDQAHSGLKGLIARSTILINTSFYRQTAVSLTKKYLPALVELFNPNTPKDYNSFLQLSF
jgi:predicted HAD superfamily hydrolase